MSVPQPLEQGKVTLEAPTATHVSRGDRVTGCRSSPRLRLAGVRRAWARLRPAYAHGALPSGADVLWTEALLERGVELHIVLPFAREEFRQGVRGTGGCGLD